MDNIIKEYLTNYAKKFGWGTNDEALFEILREGDKLYEEKKSSHRWHDVYFKVVSIDGRAIGFDDYYMTGDHNAKDMGLEYDFNSICEVVKKEKMITYYEKYNP